jgi:hypothetical protein
MHIKIFLRIPEEKKPLEIWKDTIKMGLKEIGLGARGLYLRSSEQGPVAGSCERCNKHSSSTEDG